MCDYIKIPIPNITFHSPPLRMISKLQDKTPSGDG